MKLEFYSFSDMNQAILSNLYKLPKDIDIVVGIPRSGMLPANLIALYLNKPLADIDSFMEGKTFSTGERGAFMAKERSHKILVIDDSIFFGGAISRAKSKLEPFLKRDNITFLFGVVYATDFSANKVDFYCEITGPDRIFQWNLFHHLRFTSQAYFDIDGVFCPDPPIDDDGPLYTEYIKNAPVLYRPSVEVDTLVSCRLEKYRSITEKWLKDNGVKYKRLIMLDMKNKAERLAWNKHGEYKGKIYKDSESTLFIESSLQQAKDIFRIAHKPVFCIETFSLFDSEQSFDIYDKTLREQILYYSQQEEKLKASSQELHDKILISQEQIETYKQALQKSEQNLQYFRKKQTKHLRIIRLLGFLLTLIVITFLLVLISSYII